MSKPLGHQQWRPLHSVQVIHSSGTVPSHLPSPSPRTLTLTILLPTPLRPETQSSVPITLPLSLSGQRGYLAHGLSIPHTPPVPWGTPFLWPSPHPLCHWVTHVSKITPSLFNIQTPLLNPVSPCSSYPFSALSLMSSTSFLSFSPRAQDSNQVPCPP